MKKIIVIVEDNCDFVDLLQKVIWNKFPDYNIATFNQDETAKDQLTSNYKNFDILFLNGNLAFGGHGRNVLNVLNKEQVNKTIICSGDDNFITEAENKGVSIFLDKSFTGIHSSQIDSHILKIIAKI